MLSRVFRRKSNMKASRRKLQNNLDVYKLKVVWIDR